jgi:hypothetical protein
MLFDLHLICKHIDGGLRWYCRHPLYRSRSWAAHSTQSVRQHEETYHSENTDENHKFCLLRHPESLDEHGRKEESYACLTMPSMAEPKHWRIYTPKIHQIYFLGCITPEYPQKISVHYPIMWRGLYISEEYRCSSAYYSLQFRDGMSYWMSSNFCIA